MKALDLHLHMQKLGTWVDWSKTCDGFKAGQPSVDVTGIAVGWTSVLPALQQAHAAGCNLFVTHEPTFYDHMDEDPRWRETKPARRKSRFLEQTGMVVYRCHDVWDRVPDIGITDSWATHLSLPTPTARKTYYNLYTLPAQPAHELAQRVAASVVDLDQHAVQLLGPPGKIVSRLAIGTGAITDVPTMVEMGADVILATDDGLTYWRHGTWAIDQDLPVIIVNHATAELPGMRSLADYLRRQFPDVKVEYVGPQCLYSLVGAARSGQSQLTMVLDDLSALPPADVPPGYRLHHLQPGQEWAYTQVMADSIYPGQSLEGWFERTFSSNRQYDPQNLLLIWCGDQPVAVTAAWQADLDGQQVGCIHMVGVLAAHRGKGLGKVITLAALHQLGRRGFARAILDTDDWRIPAIKAYLRLGFKPIYRDESHQARWQAAMRRIESS